MSIWQCVMTDDRYQTLVVVDLVLALPLHSVLTPITSEADLALTRPLKRCRVLEEARRLLSITYLLLKGGDNHA